MRLAEYFVAAPPGRRATRHALVILCGRQKIPSPWQGRENESEGRSCTQARQARPGVVRLAEYFVAAPPGRRATRHALVILCGRQKIPSPWQGRENESEGRSCTQARQARPGVVRLAEYSMAAPPRDAAYRLCAASASSVSAGNAGAAQREYAYPPSVQSARAY